MKLSDAIRLGAMALPEVHGPVFRYDPDGRVCGACAVGAALYAAGLKTYDFTGAGATFPLFDMDLRCPATGATSDGWKVIVNLFEEYGWSRERIADWIETIEQKQAPQAAPPAAATVLA